MVSQLNVLILFFSFVYSSYGRRRVIVFDNVHSDEIHDIEYNVLHDLTFSQPTMGSTKDSTNTKNDDTNLDRRLDSKLFSSKTTSPEDHRVINLPGLDEESAAKIKQYAGHLPVDKNNEGFLFYWLFEATNEPEKGVITTTKLHVYNFLPLSFV